MDVFIFACEECGHTAPEYEWDKAPASGGIGRGSVIGFPQPICPECGSHEVDMDHDDRPAEDLDEEEKVEAWRDVK